jgi:hypothetical protein
MSEFDFSGAAHSTTLESPGWHGSRVRQTEHDSRVQRAADFYEANRAHPSSPHNVGVWNATDVVMNSCVAMKSSETAGSRFWRDRHRRRVSVRPHFDPSHARVNSYPPSRAFRL